MSLSDVSKKYPLYPSDAPVIKLSRAVALVRLVPIKHATQGEPAALINAIRLNQARIIYKQAVTIGATNYTRRPVVAIHRLVVKPTRIPVIVARIYIRQWIRSCTKATSGGELLILLHVISCWLVKFTIKNKFLTEL